MPQPGVRRVVAALLVALGVALVLAASPAQAHASLVSSDPADGSVVREAPREVRLVFDEEVSVRADGVEVYGPGGPVVPTTSTTRGRTLVVELTSELGRGTYVVSWHASSADGHPESGILTFSVGAPSAGRPQLPASSSDRVGPLALLQAALYLALALTVGLIWFSSWVLTPRGCVDRLPDLVLALGAITVFTALAWVPMTAAYEAGAPASAGWQLVLGSWSGYQAELTSMALVAGGVTIAVLACAGGWRRIATLAGAVAVTGPAVFGHTRTADPVWLAVPADVAHVAAAAAWLGGLVGLIVAWRRLDPGQRTLTMQRFSTVATGSLAVVVVTGAFAAWRILGSWSAWVDTGYGLLLLVKIGLVAVAVATVSRHRLRGRQPTSATIAWEAGVLVAVVVVAGFLAEANPNPPSRPAPAQTGSSQTLRSGPLGTTPVGFTSRWTT